MASNVPRWPFKIAAVVASGLVLNWLSSSFTPTAPLLLSLSVIALVLLIITESTDLGQSLDVRMRATLAVARFGLTALLFGAAIGGLWLLPIWHTANLKPPEIVSQIAASFGSRATPYHNYELGSAVTIAVLASIAHARRAPLGRAVLFATAACAGSALATASLRPENAFFFTFVGWALVAVALVLASSALRDSVGTMREFFGFSGRERQARSDALGEAAQHAVEDPPH